MKKIFSLVAVFFCVIGNLLGQPELVVKMIQCDALKGRLEVQILNVPQSPPYSYSITVSRPGGGFTAQTQPYTDTDIIIVFEDLEAHSNPYLVQVSALSLSVYKSISTTFQPVAISNVERQVDCPDRPELSRIILNAQNGNSDLLIPYYTYHIKSGDGEVEDEFYTSSIAHTFTGLSRSKTWEVFIEDAHGCPSNKQTISLFPYTPMSDLVCEKEDAKCYGEDGKWTFIDVKGGIDPPTVFEINRNNMWYDEKYDEVISLPPSDQPYFIRIYDEAGCPINSKPFTITQPDPVVVNGSKTDITCNGADDATLTLSADGGTGTDYNFSIDGGSTWVHALTSSYTESYKFEPPAYILNGEYTLKAKDVNGCESVNLTLTIDEPDPLKVSASAIGLSCDIMDNPDGKITLTATGGNIPYTYKIKRTHDANGTSVTESEISSMSGEFTGLDAGTYTFTVEDANGCTVEEYNPVSESVEVKAKDPIEATIKQDNFCSGQTVTLTAEVDAGLTGPFQYKLGSGSWGTPNEFVINPAVNGELHTIWVRYVTEATGGCNGTDFEHTLIISNAVTFTPPRMDPISCHLAGDGKITVTPEAGAGFTGGTFWYGISDDNGTTWNWQEDDGLFDGLEHDIVYIVKLKSVYDNDGVDIICESDVSLPMSFTNPPKLKFNEPDVTHIPCLNSSPDNIGKIEISAIGGRGQLEYTINGGLNWQPDGLFTDLKADNYTISVQQTDGVCSNDTIVSIWQPQEIIFSLVDDKISPCDASTGSVTITVSQPTKEVAEAAGWILQYRLNGRGEWMDYDYNVQNVIINLVAGDYFVEMRYKNKDECGYITAPQAFNNSSAQDILDWSLNVAPNDCYFDETAIIVTFSSLTGMWNNSAIEFVLNGTDSNGLPVTPQTITSTTLSSPTTEEFLNLSGGEYTVFATITRSGGGPGGTSCTFSKITSFEKPEKVTIQLDDSKDPKCYESVDGEIYLSIDNSYVSLQQYYITDASDSPLQNNLTGIFTGSVTNPLPDGIYKGYATYIGANGITCKTNTEMITLSEPNKIVITTEVDHVTCKGSDGKARVTNITGGTPPFIIPYMWTNKTTGQPVDPDQLDAGFYIVTVTDTNGCSETSEVEIKLPDDYIITISGTKNDCYGSEDATITVVSDPVLPVSATYTLYKLKDNVDHETADLNNLQNYEIITSPSINASFKYTGLSGGVYRVSANTTGCSYWSNVLDIIDPPVLNVDYKNTIIIGPCANNFAGGEIHVKAEGGTPDYTFQLNRRRRVGDDDLWVPVSGIPDNPNGNGIFTDLPVTTLGTYYDLFYYVRIVDDKGCWIVRPVPETGPLLPTDPLVPEFIADDVIPVLCDGGTGSATVTVTGGREVYTLNWYKSGNDETGPWSSFTPTPGITDNTALDLELGFYKVEVTDGCNDTQTSNIIEIEDRSLNIVDSSSDNGVTCEGKPAGTISLITVYGTPNPSGTRYNYTIEKDGLPFDPDGDDNIEIDIFYDDVNKTERYTITGLEDGKYIITVTDAASCEVVSDEVEIENPPRLTVSATVEQPLCYEGSGNIKVTVTGGKPNYTITVLEGDVVVKSIPNLPQGESVIEISMKGMDQNTIKQYSITVEDANGCEERVPSVVSMKNPSQLIVLLNKSENDYTKDPITVYICPPIDNILLNPRQHGTGSGINLNYTWYQYDDLLDDWRDIREDIPGFTESVPVGIGKYYVKVTDSNGCMDESNMVTVSRYAPLEIEKYESYGVSCPDNHTGSIQIFNPSGGINGVSQYQYHVYKKGETELFLVSESETITGLPQGEYYILMMFNQTDACLESELRIPEDHNEYISIDADIQIEVVEVLSACETITGKPVIEFLVTWNNGNGNLVVMLECNGKRYYPQQTGTSGGKWKYTAELDESGEAVITVYEQFEGIDGCQIIETVQVPGSLSVNWTPEEECVTSTNITLNFTGGTAPYTVEFEGVILDNNINDNSFLIPTVVNAGRKYTVHVKDDKCPNPVTVEIELPGTVDITKINPVIGKESCSGKNDGFILLPDDSPYMLTWKDVPVNFDPGKLGEGDYMATVSFLDGQCTVDMPEPFKVGVIDHLEVTISGNDNYCPDEIMQLMGGVYAWGENEHMYDPKVNWILPDGDKVEWEDLTPLELAAAKGVVRLEATINIPAGTCSSSDVINVALNNTPTLSVTDEVVYIPIGVVEYPLEDVVVADNYTHYLWEVSNPNQVPSLPKWPDQPSPLPVYLSSPNEPFWLTLTLYNDNCWTKQDIYVDNAVDLVIPSVFTPNGVDPYNRWRFREIEKWTSLFNIHVQVYSSGGALVFETKYYDNVTPGNVFEGRRNGDNLPIGTYYYVVRLVPKTSLKSTLKPLTGSVTIIR